MKNWRLFCWLVAAAVTLAACEPEEVAHSEYFKKIFKEERGLFRGLALGVGMVEVREAEGGKPLYDDAFGLAYKVNLGEGEECLVEYMGVGGEEEAVGLDRQEESNGVEGKERELVSILVNVMLGNEAETTALYNETEAFLRGRHGVPDGSFGGYRWRDEELNLAISLRLLADKKSFSLNFARPK